ncbi:MAG: Holliday junction branch migration protein RuvA [Bacteroidales bacterium]|jgi:Holliday junction DNA helicase RuvA|nr:Holliday junction branch migration protein RuvA [Bacteroidales bacterium]MDI9574909.1 Holliday junction branch migration protein RuvA [Bacteroidota bacterium]MDD2592989.1 Holliday junction branch migration protein RuvA [Bacteroidales bacterium]MDD3755625.1 Holliday junction branch migration protein RuvA [Bacteroidales bacterium]MDY0400549.1 Holliday junction branch migration protein RuvA [Bacteroidales bacterium]
MLNYIKGLLVSINPSKVIIESLGMGFEVQITINTFEKIKESKEITVLTHLILKDDGIQLYGFADEDEREAFRLLITVNGIGPNTARNLLSTLTPIDLYSAIQSKDVTSLQKVKGIGIKSAERIIIELKNKIPEIQQSLKNLSNFDTNFYQDALLALKQLGYSVKEAENALNKVLKNHSKEEYVSLDKLIKLAFKYL